MRALTIRLAQALFAVLAVGVAGLGALEVGLRLNGTAIPLLDWERGLLTPDAALGWKGRPHARRWIENGDFDVFVDHDAGGFRGPQPVPPAAADRTVLVVGGSTAWGKGVGRGELVSDWLQQRAPYGVAVRNRAVVGYSLDQVAKSLGQALHSERFQEVVLVVSPADLAGDVPTVVEAGPRARLEELSAGARFLSRHWDRLRRVSVGPRSRESGDLPDLERRIEAMHEQCRAARVRFVVLYAAVVSQVRESDSTAANAIRARLTRLAETARIPFLDTTDVLRVASKGKVPLFNAALGTWSHRSHFLAARALLDSEVLETLRSESGDWDDVTHIPPEHDFIRFSGRFDRPLAGEMRFNWPGASIAVSIRGDSVRFLLSGAQPGEYFGVRVDGEPHTVWSPTHAQRPLELRGLGPGPHVIVVSERNESHHPIVFRGLELPRGVELLPPPSRPERRVEVIGASWASGYGNQGNHYGFANRGRKSRFCPDISRLTNATTSFGAYVAAWFEAELHLTTKIGAGLVRNFGATGPDSEGAFQVQFERTLASRPGAWDFSRWIPDVVILNLGENDFRTIEDLDAEEFRGIYTDFLDGVRLRYPETLIIAFSAERSERLVDLLEELITERRRAGDQRVEFLEHPKLRRRERGCQRHPNEAGHRRMAELLARRIEGPLGWSRSSSRTEG